LIDLFKQNILHFTVKIKSSNQSKISQNKEQTT